MHTRVTFHVRPYYKAGIDRKRGMDAAHFIRGLALVHTDAIAAHNVAKLIALHDAIDYVSVQLEFTATIGTHIGKHVDKGKKKRNTKPKTKR